MKSVTPEVTVKTIIVDIDGTLANITHRRKYVENKPKDWKNFFERANFDTLNEDIATVVRSLWLQPWPELHIVLASGRGEEHREQTVGWLLRNDIYNADVGALGVRFEYKKLYMRPAKDHRHDDIIKREILDQIRADGFEPYMAIRKNPMTEQIIEIDLSDPAHAKLLDEV